MTDNPRAHLLKSTVYARVWTGVGAPSGYSFPTLGIEDYYQDKTTGEVYGYNPITSAWSSKWTDSHNIQL